MKMDCDVCKNERSKCVGKEPKAEEPKEEPKILSSVFNALLPNPIFREVMPSEYKLFQAADLLCTLELVRLKLENNMFSKSEKTFFGNIRDLKKNYIKPLSKKEWP